MAELASRKAELLRDPVPRTSPSCRAPFCGPGCAVSPVFHTHEATIASLDFAENSISLDVAIDPSLLDGGWIRWVDGSQAGITANIVAYNGGQLVLDTPITPSAAVGMSVIAREGCDHTLGTCSTRFGNAVNFQGEPFLPGNDLLSRYPTPSQ